MSTVSEHLAHLRKIAEPYGEMYGLRQNDPQFQFHATLLCAQHLDELQKLATTACKRCHGKGCTDEGDPEIGSALFECERCGGTGREPEPPGYTEEEVAALNADEAARTPGVALPDGSQR